MFLSAIIAWLLFTCLGQAKPRVPVQSPSPLVVHVPHHETRGGGAVMMQEPINKDKLNRTHTSNALNRKNVRDRGRGTLCTTMKKSYFGLSSGAFISKDDGIWRWQKDGSARYEVSSCQLQRFTSAEARMCLSDHHLLLVGDSMMRYQFLSLAYFLEHGKWPARFLNEGDSCRHIDESGKKTCGSTENLSVASENDWARVYGHGANESWKKMHECIGGKCFRGRMDCQCVRDDFEHSMENMFYQDYAKRNLDESSTNRSKLKLSYISSLGKISMHAWKRSFCEEKGRCNLSSDGWEELRKLALADKWDYTGSITQFLDDYIPKILPDVDIAIWNAALWIEGFPSRDFVDPIFKSLYKLVNRNLKRPDLDNLELDLPPQKRGRCFYKGSSPAFTNIESMGTQSSSVFSSRDDAARLSASKAGCGNFDVTQITKQFSTFSWDGQEGRPGCCGADKEMSNVYFDSKHFQPWVNEELNQVLLNILC